MRLAVIGGSGYIGSHVVDKLLARGHEVTILDIMAPHRPDVRHIVVDILDDGRTKVALAGDYDAVYHLAALADVNFVAKIPIESIQVNVQAVVNVLEAARQTGIPRVVLASTVWIYGMCEESEVDEETSLQPHRVNHVYTASKLAAEMLCYSYRELYKLDSTILRYGIPYGPRARAGTALANFVRRALKGEPLVIQGDGSQWRTFVYVEDLAEGNALALDPKAKGQIYNLDGDRPVTIREMAETVAKLIPGTKIAYEPARPGDYRPKRVSSAKALRDLAWAPKVSFEEGTRRYIDWFRGQGGAR